MMGNIREAGGEALSSLETESSTQETNRSPNINLWTVLPLLVLFIRRLIAVADVVVEAADCVGGQSAGCCKVAAPKATPRQR